jgi:hypothetical protein
MTKKTLLIWFFIVALVAVGVHYFIFEMRYMWYVHAEDVRFMRSVYAGSMFGIFLLWAFFPSRIAVMVIGGFALFFPHLYFAPDARPLLGRTIDLNGIGIAMVALGLLDLATHLRTKGGRGANRH